MPKTANRRALSFTSLDEVMPDVDRLLGQGYTTLGNWSLGQICNHLTRALVGSVDGGFPGKAPWVVRRLIGPLILKQVLSSGCMPEGVKLPAATGPKPDLDDRAEAEALRAALGLYYSHTGPVSEHPVFGNLSRDQWDRLHRVHCAHHLSFVVPRETA